MHLMCHLASFSLSDCSYKIKFKKICSGNAIPSLPNSAFTHLSSTALPCAPTAKSISSSPSKSNRALTLRPKYFKEGEIDDPGIR